MKKSGILNAQLIRCIAELGHKDLFMIGDAGMPIPKGVEIVDLVVCGGVPTFKQVMDAVLAETEVEAYTIANEIEEKNPELLAYIQQSLPSACRTPETPRTVPAAAMPTPRRLRRGTPAAATGSSALP